jgi:hypothetical protein
MQIDAYSLRYRDECKRCGVPLIQVVRDCLVKQSSYRGMFFDRVAEWGVGPLLMRERFNIVASVVGVLPYRTTVVCRQKAAGGWAKMCARPMDVVQTETGSRVHRMSVLVEITRWDVLNYAL